MGSLKAALRHFFRNLGGLGWRENLLRQREQHRIFKIDVRAVHSRQFSNGSLEGMRPHLSQALRFRAIPGLTDQLPSAMELPTGVRVQAAQYRLTHAEPRKAVERAGEETTTPLHPHYDSVPPRENIAVPPPRLVIGCDYHPSVQQIAWIDTETGECGEKQLRHKDGEAEEFYRDLKVKGVSVSVGIEATGHARALVRAPLAELQFEL